MSDLYKGGRGGAGNFHSKSNNLDGAAKSEDIESQVLPSSTSFNDLTRIVSSSKSPPEYVHTGRGGAANYIKPKELQSQGLTQVPIISGQDARIVASAKPNYRMGRGGMGNYIASEAEEKERREKEEKEKRDREERLKVEVERRVERDVETGLTRPERAYGGATGVGAYEMKDMEGRERE